MEKYIAKYSPLILIFLFIISGLIFNFGAFDKVATQWLYLSILNVISVGYLLNKSIHNLSWFIQLLRFKPFVSYFLFILWGVISFLYAENLAEVGIKSVRFFVILVTIISISSLLKILTSPFLTVSILLTGVVLIEMYYSYSPYYQITSLTDYNFEFANILKGASANKNITAAALLIKLPFVVFLIGRASKMYLKGLLSLIIGLITFMLFLLSARAALLSLSLLFIILLGYSCINFFHIKDSKPLLERIFYVAIPIIVSFLVFQFNYRDQNSASITNRIGTINTENESVNQRLRFYSYSIDRIKTNPFLGVGLGNWKTKSVEYDKENIEGYVIPYHVHNDFLEFGAELGIIGLLLYLGVFIFILIYAFQGLKNEVMSSKFYGKSALLLSVFLIYFIDANLNFPHARVAMQIPFAILLSLMFINFKNFSEE